MNLEEINELSSKVIGYAIKAHIALGSGFVEKIYSKALEYELEKAKIKFNREKIIEVKYESIILGEHRLDFLIEEQIILEIKAVPELNSSHKAQMLSYLKSSGKKLGLILNFSRPKLEIRRIVNNL